MVPLVPSNEKARTTFPLTKPAFPESVPWFVPARSAAETSPGHQATRPLGAGRQVGTFTVRTASELRAHAKINTDFTWAGECSSIGEGRDDEGLKVRAFAPERSLRRYQIAWLPGDW